MLGKMGALRGQNIGNGIQIEVSGCKSLALHITEQFGQQVQPCPSCSPVYNPIVDCVGPKEDSSQDNIVTIKSVSCYFIINEGPAYCLVLSSVTA